MSQRRFVLLDRDGTLIVERHYLSDPGEVELLPGAVEGLRSMRALGLGLVVITNQSGIGRGFFDETRLREVHEQMTSLLAKDGVVLDGIYFCPHSPSEKCDCRKPKTALVRRAEREIGFDAAEGFVIGDKECDIRLGKQVEATTLLVRTGYGRSTETDRALQPDSVVNNLEEAATVIEQI